MCSVGLTYRLRDAHQLGKVLRHRGENNAGIGTKTEYGINVLKWYGPPSKFNLLGLQTAFKRRGNGPYLWHNRYSTSGRKDPKYIYDAHPHTIGGTERLKEEHMFVDNADCAVVHNGQVDIKLLEKLVGEDVGDHDTKAFLIAYKKLGIEELVKNVPGAYAAIFLDKDSDEVIGVRDRYGMRPLWLGEKDGKYIMSSEDFSISEIGGRVVRPVRHGEAIFIKDHKIRTKQIIEPKSGRCFFDSTYIEDERSSFLGKVSRNIRYDLGVELAREFKMQADFVTYIPSCPRPTAYGYSEESGVPFEDIFYKIDTEKRSFMEQGQEERWRSIEKNLNIINDIDIRGKKVIIIDDSIVRGTVSRRAVKLCRDAGADKIYFLSAIPPIGKSKGCIYGVDMPDDDKFVIREYGNEEGVRKHIGADELHYLSKEATERAIEKKEDELCMRCIDGRDPLKDLENDKYELPVIQ